MKKLDKFDIDTIKAMSKFFGFIGAVATMAVGFMLKETGMNFYGIVAIAIEIAATLLFVIVGFSEDETLIEVESILQLVKMGMTNKEA